MTACTKPSDMTTSTFVLIVPHNRNWVWFRSHRSNISRTSSFDVVAQRPTDQPNSTRAAEVGARALLELRSHTKMSRSWLDMFLRTNIDGSHAVLFLPLHSSIDIFWGRRRFHILSFPFVFPRFYLYKGTFPSTEVQQTKWLSTARREQKHPSHQTIPQSENNNRSAN